MRIEIYCAGRKLDSAGDRSEYAHRAEPVETFVGDIGNWSATGPNANKHIARLDADDRYEHRGQRGSRGRAAAAARFDTPTPAQQELLQSSQRMNYNLRCTHVDSATGIACGRQFSRRDTDLHAGLDRIATLHPGDDAAACSLDELRSACP